jgi:hypothetical protein
MTTITARPPPPSLHLEQSILENYKAHMHMRGLQPTPKQSECISKFQWNLVGGVGASLVFWGVFAGRILDFRPAASEAADASILQKGNSYSESCLNSHPPWSTTQQLTSKVPVHRTKNPPKRPLPPRLPVWLNVMCMVTASTGLFVTSFYVSKMAARSCIQCVIDSDDQVSEMNRVMRQLVKDFHPNSDQFFPLKK